MLYVITPVWLRSHNRKWSPPVKGDDYLGTVGHRIRALVTAVDPKAIWVMQTWSMRDPIVKAVAKDKLLVMHLSGSCCRIGCL